MRRVPRCPARCARHRPGPPPRMERPRALAHTDRSLGQWHPLVAAEGAREPDDRPARHARRGPDPQPPALPRLPAARRAAAALPPRRPWLAPAHPDAWLAWESRSRLQPFIRLARTLRAHRDGILAAIRLGLSNGRLEGLNSKIRLLSHRSYGFHSPTPSSPSSTSAAPASSSTSRDDIHPQIDRSAVCKAHHYGRARLRLTAPATCCASSPTKAARLGLASKRPTCAGLYVVRARERGGALASPRKQERPTRTNSRG
jgi:hypothetical protein